MTQSIFQAQPFELPFDPRTTALVMIDMQRDFVEAGASVRHWAMMFHGYARLSHHVQRKAGSRTSKRNYGYSYS